MQPPAADGSADSEFQELLSSERVAEDGTPGDAAARRLRDLRMRFGGDPDQQWQPAEDSAAVRFFVAMTGLPTSAVRADLATRLRRGQLRARLQPDGAVALFEADAEIRVPHFDFPPGFDAWAAGVPAARAQAATYTWLVLNLAARPLTPDAVDQAGPRPGSCDVAGALADLVARGWVRRDPTGHHLPVTSAASGPSVD